MIAHYGPAHVGWKPFGGLGQVTAVVTPPESLAPAQEKQNALPKIAEVVALMAAGALALYLILIFADEGASERRVGP